jgi:hypothetical protein
MLLIFVKRPLDTDSACFPQALPYHYMGVSRSLNAVEVAANRCVLVFKALLLTLRVRDDFDEEFAAARTVEFSEEDHLPAAQQEFPILDPDGFARAD